MACGLALSTLGSVWALYVGHGLLIGVIGKGAIYAPLLISSGQYIAGVVWPSVFEQGIPRFGWQGTMLAYAVVVDALKILVEYIRGNIRRRSLCAP